jgi:hypothetical protein
LAEVHKRKIAEETALRESSMAEVSCAPVESSMRHCMLTAGG